MEDYRTIRGTAIGEYEEKKSRFIAQLSFADSEEKAVAFLEQVRAANRTARHNVYAYRLREGSRERYSDDGEPAKTAGTPALEVLQHSGLTDLIVVITRYFGGVLLGTGGLVRAYTTATSRALEAAEVVTVRSVVALDVTVDYGLYERADLLIKAAGGIASAEQVNALLAMGAAGVSVGTALLTTAESSACDAHRYYAEFGTACDTVLTRIYNGRLSRVLRNALVEALDDWELMTAGYPAQKALMGPLDRCASEVGRNDLVMLPLGQSAGRSAYRRTADCVHALFPRRAD